MPSLRDIRSRITTVRNTQQITRAMKMVAAAKLRRAQERIFAARPYAFKVRDLITNLQGRVDPSGHPLFQPREAVNAVLLVVVTSDRGLAGAFNTNIIKLAEQTIATRYADYRQRGALYLMCIGRKGHDHFSKRGFQLVGDYRGFFNNLRFEALQGAVDAVVEGYLDGRWDEVQVIYNEFKNTISQNRIVEPLLPITGERFLTPIMETFAVDRPADGAGTADYLYEPDPGAILAALVPQYLTFQMWRVVLESNAAEQGARMVAMDNATTNAGELLGQLRLNYNRARQAAITKEILEISSGAEALHAD